VQHNAEYVNPNTSRLNKRGSTALVTSFHIARVSNVEAVPRLPAVWTERGRNLRSYKSNIAEDA
jgi:hypothetical protein